MGARVIVFMVAIALVNTSCDSAARDYLSQCSAAIESEREVTKGTRVFDMGPTVGRIDISTLNDRLGDLEDELHLMEIEIANGESVDTLSARQEDVRRAFTRFEEDFDSQMSNHFEYCRETTSR